MDENGSTSTSNSGSKKNWIIIAIVVIAIVLLVAGGGFFYMNSQKETTTVVENKTPTPGTDTTTEGMTESSTEPQSSNYKDGTYTATGTYSYHSGTESVRVTVTIANGVVEDIRVTSLAKAPTSKTMQADFIANYKALVVGKNIDDLNISKVSGSSLTGIGFNAAIEDIKSQAQG